MRKGLVSTCLCYFDQAHVTWGSCGSKQPVVFFFLEITSKEQSSSFKIKQFTKGTAFFKERLGLAFKKVDGKLCCSHPRFSQGFLHCISKFSDILHTVLSTFLIIIMGRFCLELNLY